LEGKELRDLIDFISKSNFVTFELEREGFKLKLEKGGGPAASPPFLVGPAPHNAGAPAPDPATTVPVAPDATVSSAGSSTSALEPRSTGLIDMTSPIVGTFYRQPSQAAPPFVEPGSRVKKGQVLCIIEAMKLMNEIEAEIDAEIVEILVANGQPVEFGEILFRLRPLAS
jgi:acetyl-CoA carboxylase biotin carboxyl carrier protein